MSTPETKNLLFVFDKPPHSSPAAKEGLDALLTASAFGQNITLFLIGCGLFQILKNQKPSSLPSKNTSAIFEALEIYGIDNVIVLDSDLRENALTAEDLVIPVNILDGTQIANLYAEQHQILTF